MNRHAYSRWGRGISGLLINRTARRISESERFLDGRMVERAKEHVGLLEAMMSAGARSVVADLWEVDDAATQALFKGFYEKVVDGDSPADALAEAAGVVPSGP